MTLPRGFKTHLRKEKDKDLDVIDCTDFDDDEILYKEVEKEEEDKEEINIKVWDIVNPRYREGMTEVILHEGKYYFWGDFGHCQPVDILYNARIMRAEMLSKGKKFGYKDFQGKPEFKDKYNWGIEEKKRVNWYSEKLFYFEGEEVYLSIMGGR